STFFRHDVAIEAPASIEEAHALLRATHADLVMVAGGDGTVNVALQAIGSRPLALLPSGTANDLAEELKVPRDVERACEIAKLKQLRAIDLIDANGFLFATSGGTGMAADVAADTNRFKSSVGKLPGVRDLVKSVGKELYQVFLLKEFAFPSMRRLRLRFDASEREVSTALVMINNQSLVGGSFAIAPGTQNDDGTFAVSVFLDDDAASLARTTAVVRSGKKPDASALLQFETAHLTIDALDDKPLSFFGDGELAPSSTSLALTIKPKALLVAAP
ncbi:MAG TPA: diacylglycerol kinase family protein, partial [Myxococcota bacterium]